MTDISVVEASIVSLLGRIFFDDDAYADGITTVSPITGKNMSIYRGYPVPADLDRSIVAGECDITVIPVNGMTRQARFRNSPARVLPGIAPTMTATLTGTAVTFAGSATAGQLVGVGQGGTGYSIRLTGSETPQSVAQTMATRIPGSTASGAVLTLSGSSRAIAGQAGQSVSRSILRRQGQAFEIKIWAPSPEVRDVVGAIFLRPMAGLRYIELSNGEITSQPRQIGVWSDDFASKAHTFTRTERYDLEYSTTIDTVVPGILFAGVNSNVVGRFGYFHPDGPVTPTEV